MTTTACTTRDLRRRWKPHKERLGGHPTAIRFHRACSWLDRAEKLDSTDTDLILINQWIAFNALYGHWNEKSAEPAPDRDSWQQLVTRLLKLDRAGVIVDVLTVHKPLVLCLVEDEYLAGIYWRDPCPRSRQSARNSKRKVLSMYVERNWTLILDCLLDRVYFLRCQLMHGAATCGGKLNRMALSRATQMLRLLLPTFLTVFIDHGADENWGALCYPPTSSTQSTPSAAQPGGSVWTPGKPR